MANTIYLSAGLPVAKGGETPSGNTLYLSAGLPPEVSAGFDAIRADIIAGLDGDLVDKWDDSVITALLADLGSVVRTSPTVVTITIPAVAAYDITEQETITATVPASALVLSGDAVEASPSFTVDEVAAGGGITAGSLSLMGVGI